MRIQSPLSLWDPSTSEGWAGGEGIGESHRQDKAFFSQQPSPRGKGDQFAKVQLLRAAESVDEVPQFFGSEAKSSQ